MIYIYLNLLAISVATLISIGIARAAQPKRGRRIGFGGGVVMLAAHFWLMAILAGALILAPSKAGAWTMALGSAAVIWAGFVGPVLVISGVQRGDRAGLIVRSALSWLVAMLLAAAALHLIGLRAPPA